MEYFLTFVAFFIVGKMISDIHTNSQAEAWRRKKEQNNGR